MRENETVVCWSCKKPFLRHVAKVVDGFAFCPDCGVENDLCLPLPNVDRYVTQQESPKGHPRWTPTVQQEQPWKEQPRKEVSGVEVDESLAHFMLIVPVVGSLLIQYWVGEMSLIQGVASSLTLIGLATTLVTAGLAAADAKRLGIGRAGDPDKSTMSHPIAWFAVVVLLWPISFPAYLFARIRYGAKSYLLPVLGIFVSCLFLVSYMNMSSKIEARMQQEVREILERTKAKLQAAERILEQWQD